MSVRELVFLTITLLAFGAANANETSVSDDFRMLVIHSYGANSIWVKGIEQGLLQTIPDTVTVHHSYLNTKHLPSAHHAESAEIAWQRFLELKPQLVVICDDNALRLLGERISDQVPMVFCGINGGLRTDYPWALDGRSVTGVMERPVIRRAAFMMNKVINLNAQRALILLGDSTTAKAFLKYDMGDQRKSLIWEDLSAEVRVVDNLASFQEEVRRCRKEGFDFLLVAGHQALRDQSGRAVSLDETNEWISRNSPLPAFTVHLNSIGKNRLIGGLTLHGAMMGQETGRLIQEVLKQNLKTQGIPIVYYDRGQITVSVSELERYSLKVRQDFKDKVTFVK